MKKLLEKDGFYLALFASVFLVAVGGILFTKNSVDKIANNDLLVDEKEESEVHLIENDEEKTVATSTESKENLETAQAKKQPESKLHFLGNVVTRGYSETEPSYSKTLDVWEIHKGIDVSAKQGSEVKSLLNGKVVDVFNDKEHGMSVKVQSEDDILVVYSNLAENISVKKNQEVKEGDLLGVVGKTTFIESGEESHVHVEAFKGKEAIDPMSLIK